MTTKNLPNLDKILISALDFFIKNPPAKLAINKFKFPMVIGSGNAYNTALLLFGDRPAIIANESNFSQIIKNYQSWIKDKTITEALVISASGEKDSVWELKMAKKYGLKTNLLTCSPNSNAAQISDKTLIYKKIAEPYTYNTSTYLGIILGASGEKPQKIKTFLNKLILPKKTWNFKNYFAYSFILPDEFSALAAMINIKKDELFGPHLALRAFTFGEARHAKFIHSWQKELVISYGQNLYFGNKENRWEIKMPKKIGPGFIMSLSYYLIGKIQEVKPPYFKRHIAKFCAQGAAAYQKKKPFSIIVK